MPGHYNKKKKVAKGGNPGGIPNKPWDDPSKEKGPFVPAPGKLAKKHVVNDVNV
tara:strand:- start:415 stop:576 length:162 start_codon:yes stop_codon:yes gene_type:complete